MQITPSGLIRWAGMPTMLAGFIFAGIQPIHPPDVVSSVTSGAWVLITPLKTVMCLLILIGVTAIYARQVTRVGCLGAHVRRRVRRDCDPAAPGPRRASVCG